MVVWFSSIHTHLNLAVFFYWYFLKFLYFKGDTLLLACETINLWVFIHSNLTDIFLLCGNYFKIEQHVQNLLT